MNVDCSSISRGCQTGLLPREKIEKEESVSRVNSRIVPVCCTILTYVHNYVSIVTVDYLLSCLVKLVKIYSFFQYYQLFWYWWIKIIIIIGVKSRVYDRIVNFAVPFSAEICTAIRYFLSTAYCTALLFWIFDPSYCNTHLQYRMVSLLCSGKILTEWHVFAMNYYTNCGIFRHDGVSSSC